VIGDTAADVGAAQAAGALGILVEIEEGEADKIEHKAFSTVVHSLTEAVDTVLSGVR
jgi:phosphoglycolate phosphatase-like HAD superfamily hydrolase